MFFATFCMHDTSAAAEPSRSAACRLDHYVVMQDSLTSREHLVIVFPVLLLCMRVVLETILRNTFVSLFDVPHISFR
jgi:hypothetical protein